MRQIYRRAAGAQRTPLAAARQPRHRPPQACDLPALSVKSPALRTVTASLPPQLGVLVLELRELERRELLVFDSVRPAALSVDGQVRVDLRHLLGDEAELAGVRAAVDVAAAVSERHRPQAHQSLGPRSERV